MAEYALTQNAERDLARIANYTIENFGIEQARRYRDDLFLAFKTLADNPRMGRDFSRVKEGVRRHDHKKHSIYYTLTDTGILILQILHERQDPDLKF